MQSTSGCRTRFTDNSCCVGSNEIWCITFPDDTDAHRSYVCPVKDCSKQCTRPGLLVSHMAVDHSELRDKKLLTFNAQLDVQSMDVRFIPGNRGAYNLGDPKFQAARKRQATQGIKKPSQRTRRKQVDSTDVSTETKHHQQVQSLNEKLMQAEIARREDAQQTTAQVLEVLKQISSTNATLVENNKQLALHSRSNLPPHLQVAQQRLNSKASADLARRKASH